MTKVVVVTGASRGIGAATAKLLAAEGYQVCVNYLSNHLQAQAVVEHITSHGGSAFTFQADVSDENQVISMFDEVVNRYKTITHLVNNAGILKPQSKLVDLTVERIKQVLNTNVTGSFICCREAIKRMSSGGAIVNVGSAASRLGAPNEYIDYAASKGAIDSLTIGLSLELAAQNIRVNCVRPGCIDTEIHTDGGEPDRVNRLAPMLPMQRAGTSAEVAQAISWLLSDEASYVTGSFLDLAGGR